jgi:oligopeptide/dipeptide ABC transporter ATP-binding protein
MIRPLLLKVKDVSKEYPVRGGLLQRTVGTVKAVDSVSLELTEGHTFGVLGESGCGKSTLSRLILALERPTSGEIRFREKDVSTLNRTELKAVRRDVQAVFQDPYGALPPKMRIGRILEEPFRIHGLQTSGAAGSLLERVELPARLASRYPNELSGGQRQRVVIARALALEPSLVVCDEAVSALDVSVQAKILDLLETLQTELSLSYLFISHDLGVVRHVADELGVMYLGSMVEQGPAKDVYADAFHPYTWSLLWARPSVRGHRLRRGAKGAVRGEQPSPLNVPSGCKFRTRCPLATTKCKAERPPLREVVPGRFAACHYAEEVPRRMASLGQTTPPATEGADEPSRGPA